MGPGKAFELFVKRILIHIGFSEVVSDGLYIYDGAPGQMIQGLGEAHNADGAASPNPLLFKDKTSYRVQRL